MGSRTVEASLHGFLVLSPRHPEPLLEFPVLELVGRGSLSHQRPAKRGISRRFAKVNMQFPLARSSGEFGGWFGRHQQRVLVHGPFETLIEELPWAA